MYQDIFLPLAQIDKRVRMNKNTVLNKLSLLKEKLSSQYGVDKIGLFGSVIRGENRKNSDIDILVDFQEGKEIY